ncbi:hypothetical protein HDU89_000679 [Geranomyces variabilis]|nr:hypothetical protein HDU89_000679 [Geranomyces variabilis]
MGIKIHGVAFSTCTQRIAVALREKQVPFELVVVDFANGGHKSPEHLKMQPFGQVPVLEDDGFFLYESRAVVRYISRKYAGQGTELCPTDLKGAALVEQAASVESSNFDAYASPLVFETVFKKMYGQTTDPARVTELRQKLEAKLDVYETILAKQPYLAGDNLSFADLFHLPYGSMLATGGHGDVITSRPHVKAWFEKLQARPSWKETVAAAQQK